MPCNLCKKPLADEVWYIRIIKYTKHPKQHVSDPFLPTADEGGMGVCEECIESFVVWRDGRDAKLQELKARREAAEKSDFDLDEYKEYKEGVWQNEALL